MQTWGLMTVVGGGAGGIRNTKSNNHFLVLKGRWGENPGPKNGGGTERLIVTAARRKKKRLIARAGRGEGAWVV